MDPFQNSDLPALGPEIYSTGVDRPSEFSLLPTTEAPGNFVDPRPRDILPYTTLAPGIDLDYADFMRRARWKAYQTTRRCERAGNYLEMHKLRHTSPGETVFPLAAG